MRIPAESYHYCPAGKKRPLGERGFDAASYDAVTIAHFHKKAAKLIENLVKIEEYRSATIEEIQEQFTILLGAPATVNNKTKKIKSFSHKWLYIHHEDK